MHTSRELKDVYRTPLHGFAQANPDGEGFVFVKPPKIQLIPPFKIGEKVPDHWIKDLIPTHFWLKEKTTRFGWHHLPSGTEFEVDLNPYQGRAFVVSHITHNAPSSFLVHTTIPVPETGTASDLFLCNVDYVSKIIKRGKGKASVSRAGQQRDRSDYFHQHQRMYGSLNMPKHPSQYQTGSIRELLYHLTTELIPDGGHLDMDYLFHEIVHKSEMFKRHDYKCSPKSEFSIALHTVNKKRLRKKIKQVLNKCLADTKKAQRAHEAMFDVAYADMHDRDDDVNPPYKITNTHGEPQYVLVEHGKEVNVCGSCGTYVRPNTGQGTDCDACNHEADMHASHDYEFTVSELFTGHNLDTAPVEASHFGDGSDPRPSGI